MAGFNSIVTATQKSVNRYNAQQQQYAQQAVNSAAANNKFNADQAALDRAFQERMSSTAHQRQVADLKAAGLSPVLSANSGAPMASGASATADTSITSVLGGLASNAMSAAANLSSTLQQSMTQVKTANINAKTQKWTTKYNAKTQKKIAKMNNETQKYVSNNSKQAAIQSAQIGAAASAYAAQLGLESTQVQAFASKYAAKLSYTASLHSTDSQSATANKKILVDQAMTELGIGVNAATSIINGLLGVAGSILGSRR